MSDADVKIKMTRAEANMKHLELLLQKVNKLLSPGTLVRFKNDAALYTPAATVSGYEIFRPDVRELFVVTSCVLHKNNQEDVIMFSLVSCRYGFVVIHDSFGYVAGRIEAIV